MYKISQKVLVLPREVAFSVIAPIQGYTGNLDLWEMEKWKRESVTIFFCAYPNLILLYKGFFTCCLIARSLPFLH